MKRLLLFVTLACSILPSFGRVGDDSSQAIDSIVKYLSDRCLNSDTPSARSIYNKGGALRLQSLFRQLRSEDTRSQHLLRCALALPHPSSLLRRQLLGRCKSLQLSDVASCLAMEPSA